MVEFIEVGATSDLSAGTMKEYRVADTNILVARVGDDYFATQGRCPHMGGVLAQGKLAGKVVTCPRHHSQFDLKDGRVIRWTTWEGLTYFIAKTLKPPRPLKTYEVKTENNKIMVKVGA